MVRNSILLFDDVASFPMYYKKHTACAYGNIPIKLMKTPYSNWHCENRLGHDTSSQRRNIHTIVQVVKDNVQSIHVADFLDVNHGIEGRL